MKRIFLLALVAMSTFRLSAAREELALHGTWRFQLDRADEGVGGRWFARDLDGRLKLPGSLQEQGFGDAVTVDTKWIGQIVDRSWFLDPAFAPYRQPGNIKIPFWLQPEKHYMGAAWYQREIEIPRDWQGRRVVLSLERSHWQTSVWIDDRFLGTNVSLSTPHVYDLGTTVTPGKHRLTIRVDNRLIVDVGVNSHSVSDHTQGNWNGLAGALRLTATDPVWVEDVQVFPLAAERKARVRVTLGNASGQPASGQLTLQVSGKHAVAAPRLPLVMQSVTIPAGALTTELDVALGADAKLWDEFQPALYEVRAEIFGAAVRFPAASGKAVSFGLRNVQRDGTQIAVNGRKVFLRGTLECAIFPLTGYPPTDVESWKRIIRTCQAHGLNHIRFHSWCPPEAAFVAADELGFYYQVECASWPNGSTTLGDGKPVDQWLYDESERIVRTYGNHPSFLLMASGNEPGGPNHPRWLKQFVAHWKSKDSRRLYTSGAGWPAIPENDYHVSPDPRIMAWGGGLNARINARPPETMTDYRQFIAKAGAPVISHEIGQWCVYPNFDEIKKYTGWLKARNFEIFRESLRRRGMLHQAREFLFASGKLQTLCYKEDIESALRTPGMAGFELLDLHDFPGQGTALVGVLDPFWDSKGYVTPAEYRRFAGETVPLARMPKRILQNDETFTARIEIGNFGPNNLAANPVTWTVRDGRKTVASGEFPAKPLPTGTQTSVGELKLPLEKFSRATKLNLEVTVKGTRFANDWDLWVYPAKVEKAPPAGIHLATSLDEAARAVLARGGKVLLLPPPARIKGDELGPVKIGFSSMFWNTAWTGRQAPHTLGILCDPKHPALAEFPTEKHCNWQWWELVSRSHPFILNDTPESFTPIVQAIDDWVTNRKLGLVWEAQVGPGRLLACGIDLSDDLEHRPVARQLRRSLLDYMNGDRFAPKLKMDAPFVEGLMQPPSAMDKLGARIISTDSAQDGHPAANILDGDPRTIWHSAWGDSAPAFPHEVVIGFNAPATLQGITLLPRQEMKNGWFQDYAIFVSLDGQSWGPPVAKGSLSADKQAQAIRFGLPVRAKFLKVQALSSFDRGQPYASLAELSIDAE